MRVLSIDPAVRNTGYAIIDGDHMQRKVLDFGVISIPKSIIQSAALGAICGGVSNLIKKWHPEEIAVEGVIYVQSHRTAITMGAARAAVMIAGSNAGLPIYEYAPLKVKQAVVGNGKASKEQVAFMIRALLGLSETPPHDAADALAIAYAHTSASDPIKGRLIERRKV